MKPSEMKNKDLSEENDAMYKDLVRKEMKKRLKEKIDNNDPGIVKTIKAMLADDIKKGN